MEEASKGSGKSREYSYFMTEEWWDRFVEAFNASPTLFPLSWSGGICFEVTNSSKSPVWIVWDSKVHRVPALVSGFPRLSATESAWRALINGELDAAAGLTKGKINFVGSSVRLAQLPELLEEFTRIAREISHS